MGYILPVNSYQSQQYANRILDVNDDYAKVSQLRKVPKTGDYKESFEGVVEQKESELKMQGRYDSLAASRSRSEVIGYINPNPVNMSIKNGPVIKKGAAINAYV